MIQQPSCAMVTFIGPRIHLFYLFIDIAVTRDEDALSAPRVRDENARSTHCLLDILVNFNRAIIKIFGHFPVFATEKRPFSCAFHAQEGKLIPPSRTNYSINTEYRVSLGKNFSPDAYRRQPSSFVTLTLSTRVNWISRRNFLPNGTNSPETAREWMNKRGPSVWLENWE